MLMSSVSDICFIECPSDARSTISFIRLGERSYTNSHLSKVSTALQSSLLINACRVNGVPLLYVSLI